MKPFLILWLTALIFGAACVVALNVAVDPYGILGTPRIQGLTAEKTAAADRPRLTKPYLVDRADPHTIVLGASNADVGINPESPAWPEAVRPVFNLAIDGSQPTVQFRYLQHAFARSHPKLILLGLSVEDAMILPQKRVSSAVQALYDYEQRLHTLSDGQPNPGYSVAYIQDLLFATLSTQALTDSILTLLRQGQGGRNQQTAMGLNTADSFVRWTNTEGAYSLVMSKDREKTPQFVFWSIDPRTLTAPVGDIIRLAHAHGAEVIVFIMPNYVDELEIFRQTGLTAVSNAWKTQIAAIVEQAAAGGPPVPLWDFTGYSRFTTQPLPASGDTKTQLTWFWEPIHFRAALGDLLIQRMLGTGGPADLGTKITSATLPAQLADFQQQQRQWVATHPGDVERIATIVDAAAKAVCHVPFAQCPKPGPQTTASR